MGICQGINYYFSTFVKLQVYEISPVSNNHKYPTFIYLRSFTSVIFTSLNPRLTKKWTFHQKSADNGNVRLKPVNAETKLYF